MRRLSKCPMGRHRISSSKQSRHSPATSNWQYDISGTDFAVTIPAARSSIDHNRGAIYLRCTRTERRSGKSEPNSEAAEFRRSQITLRECQSAPLKSNSRQITADQPKNARAWVLRRGCSRMTVAATTPTSIAIHKGQSIWSRHCAPMRQRGWTIHRAGLIMPAKRSPLIQSSRT